MSVQPQRRGRLHLIAGFSLFLHAIILGWLAKPTSPRLATTAADPSLMSVELVSPARRDALRPSVSRQSQAIDRPRRFQPEPPTGEVRPAVDPLPSPVTTNPGSNVATPSTGAPGLDGLRAVLRAGAGCSAPVLSRGEREKCQEKLGRMSASAPRYDAPMDPGKRAYFDQVAAAGPSGLASKDPTPRGVSPGSAYFPFLKCSVAFGVGKKPKDTQGTVRLGRSPCAVPLQGSFFTPEASVQKR
jgi:hypothetical protein